MLKALKETTNPREMLMMTCTQIEMAQLEHSVRVKRPKAKRKSAAPDSIITLPLINHQIFYLNDDLSEN